MSEGTVRMFPVLWSYDRNIVRVLTSTGCPRHVPWSLVAPHEAQARANHGQTLQRLAERGGLSPGELLAVLEDRPWRLMRDLETVARLLELVSAGVADTLVRGDRNGSDGQ